MRVAVIPAAGSGRRFGGKKQFYRILGKPVVEFPLEIFEKSELIDTVILVLPREDLDFGEKLKLKFKKISAVVEGGNERQSSVFKGLLKAAEFQPEEVIVHDGVRPILELSLINQLVVALSDYEADGVIPGVKPKDTVKEVGSPLEPGDFIVEKTLNRDRLIMVQTPQIFRFNVLLECHQRATKEEIVVTDDSALLEKFGYTVVSITGNYRNIKITTPEDVKIAELLLKDLYFEGI